VEDSCSNIDISMICTQVQDGANFPRNVHNDRRVRVSELVSRV